MNDQSFFLAKERLPSPISFREMIKVFMLSKFKTLKQTLRTLTLPWKCVFGWTGGWEEEGGNHSRWWERKDHVYIGSTNNNNYYFTKMYKPNPHEVTIDPHITLVLQPHANLLEKCLSLPTGVHAPCMHPAERNVRVRNTWKKHNIGHMHRARWTHTTSAAEFIFQSYR